jgi:chromosome segregation ATPase
LETFVAYVNAQLQETNARLQAADARQQATDAQLEEVRARLDAYERQRADRRPKLQRGGRTTGRKRRAKARADARTIPSRIAD